MENNNSKEVFVGDLTLPPSFNTDLGEITFDEENVIEENSNESSSPSVFVDEHKNDPLEIDVKDPVNIPEVEEKDVVAADTVVDDVVEEIEEVEKDPLAEYTDTALIAISEIREGNFDLDENEIPSDLSALTLRELYRKNNELQIENAKKELYDSAGEASKYLEFLLSGGDPNALQQAISQNKYGSLNIEEEDNQRAIIKAHYESVGILPEDIEGFVEDIFDKGVQLQRATRAQEYFKTKEDNILKEAEENSRAQKAQAQEQYDRYVNSMKTIISSGNIAGYSLNKKKQKELDDALFKPTEISNVTDPNTGKKVKQRVTKIQALQEQLNKDPEKLAAFSLWLLEGGKFDFVKDQAKEERDDSLRSLLQNTKTKTVKRRRQSRTENYFDDIAKELAEYNNNY